MLQRPSCEAMLGPHRAHGDEVHAARLCRQHRHELLELAGRERARADRALVACEHDGREVVALDEAIECAPACEAGGE